MTDRNQSWQEMCLLSERILRANSASEEIERWCRERSIGDGRIFALSARHAIPEALDYKSLQALYPHDARGKALFRRVRLATSAIVVMDAINWYFPANLTAEIREQLETTGIPFGDAIKPLQTKRRTFLVRRCMPEQLVDEWRSIDPAGVAFEHRAVIYGNGELPLAVVHERFRVTLVSRPPECATAAAQPFNLRNAPIPHPCRTGSTRAEGNGISEGLFDFHAIAGPTMVQTMHAWPG
jgi:hypothetical protein